MRMPTTWRFALFSLSAGVSRVVGVIRRRRAGRRSTSSWGVAIYHAVDSLTERIRDQIPYRRNHDITKHVIGNALDIPSEEHLLHPGTERCPSNHCVVRYDLEIGLPLNRFGSRSLWFLAITGKILHDESLEGKLKGRVIRPISLSCTLDIKRLRLFHNARRWLPRFVSPF